MDPAASHTLHAQITMFQELLLLVLPREIYFKQKLALCTLLSKNSYFQNCGVCTISQYLLQPGTTDNLLYTQLETFQ